MDLCKECVRRKYSLKDIQKIFREGGCQLLSKEYNNTQQKLSYVCSCGSISEITLNHFREGKRCKFCQSKRFSVKVKGRKINGSLTEEERERKRNMSGTWSRNVKERDKYTCQNCGFKGKPKDGFLVSHHLESYKWNKEILLDLHNGICLCRECHKEFHSIYGQGKNEPNTRKQMNEFLTKYL
jgi:5-methylcytosine-specific restriction endonuclease McrA